MRSPAMFFPLIVLLSVGIAGAAWIPVESPVVDEPIMVGVHSVAADAWDVDLSVSGIEIEAVLSDDGSVSLVTIPDAPALSHDGGPELPTLVRMFALRYAGQPTLELVDAEWMDVEGTYRLAPPPDDIASASDVAMISRDAFLPEAAVWVSPVAIMGGVSLATVHVSVVRYNSVQQRLQVLRRASLRLTEQGPPIRYDRPITESIASILRPVTPNWDDLRLDELIVKGTYLFIVADHGTVEPGIQDLVRWRNRKGHTIEVAGPNQIANWTTTGVKSYIQGRYNSANPPLEFVCLVGDANGTLDIPYYTYGYSSGAGDWDYTRLDGTDLLPDVAIGRFCIQDGTQLAKQRNRTLRYEKTPAAINSGTRPNWYRGGGLFCGSLSGNSPVQVLRWVRERMLDVGFTSSSIDTVYWSNESVTPTKMNNSINAGTLLWCFRGYQNMNGYSNSDVNNLTNEGHWPFLLTLTCNTNDFSLDDVSEAFMNGGTPDHPTGAVAVIGMSSSETHTRLNNILMGGSVQALLRESIWNAGAVLMRAKLELYNSYPLDSTYVALFCGITSLLGDPALDVITSTPDTLYVNNPGTVPIGTNTLTLTVTNTDGQLVQGAYVNLVKGTEVFVGGWTNASGQILLNFATTTAETLFVTASKHNHRPAANYTLVQSQTQFVSPSSATFVIDDDNSGSSSGNSDGKAGPSETIELAIPLKNWGTSLVSGVNATLSITHPFITSIGDNLESYGNINAGAIVNPPDDFDFSTASYVTDGYVVPFTLTVTDNAAHTWVSTVPIRMSNGNLEYVSHTLGGVGNGILDPNETGTIYLTLTNAGTKATAASTTAYLRSNNPAVSITDSTGVFTAAAIGGQCNNSANTFGISASTVAFPGEQIPLSCIFPLSAGFADTVKLNLYIGSIASTTPTPPDSYGYWAFDNTDVSFAKHPTYSWVEIDSRQGGPGTVVNIVDNGEDQDRSAVVNLPFPFRFYGQDFNQITICSNGWIGMGADNVVHTEFRNYTIPSALGPSGMLAVFWDDLLVPPVSMELPQERAHRDRLDEGGETCASAVVISTLPYNDTGNTSDNTSECANPSRDVFYTYTVPAGGQTITISLCGSSYDTYLWVWSTCCVTEIAHDDDGGGCGLGSYISRTYGAGQIWIQVEGYGSSSGAYTMSVTEITPPQPAGIYTYHDAVNHRFIVEWSNVQKYDGSAPYPTETFECILYQPGYPATPTGDGEILLQYMVCNNTTDDAASNDYATVGIENLTETDGVLYSYFNQVSPYIPGAATMTNSRAILFTTQKVPVDTPSAPQALTTLVQGSNLRLRWNAVRTDIHGSPLPNVQYKIYRGTVSDFPRDGTTYLATVSDTTYLDTPFTVAKYFYVVQAIVPVAGLASAAPPIQAPAIAPNRERILPQKN